MKRPADPWAELARLRQLAEDLTARVEALHRLALTHADPATEDPLELALRAAKHRGAALAGALHQAVTASRAELQPLRRVDRR